LGADDRIMLIAKLVEIGVVYPNVLDELELALDIGIHRHKAESSRRFVCRALLEGLLLAPVLEDFLTLPAYALLD